MTTRAPEHGISSTKHKPYPWQFRQVFTAAWEPDRSTTIDAKTETSYSPTAPTSSEIDLERWVAAAMRHADTRFIDGYYVAEVPGLPEAWMDGTTPEEALDALPDVLFDWAELALEEGHTLPSFDGADPSP